MTQNDNRREIDRLPRVLTWVGIGFALTVPVIVVAILVGEPDGPPGRATEWPRYAALGPLVLLPTAVAVLGLRYRRRALLATAAVLALLLGIIAIPFGLLFWVSTIAWVQAASRIPGLERRARRAPWPAVVALPAVLAIAAGVALFIHQDPACWTYEEYPEGTRVYGEAEPHPASSGGFGFPSPISTGTETAGTVEVDSETGQPVEPDAPRTGQVCVSDHVTVPQGAVSLLLTLSAGAVAVRLGRPRASSSEAAERSNPR